MQAWKDIYTSYMHKQQQASPPEPDKSPLTGNLQADLQALQARLGDNGDLVVRDFQLFGAHQAAMLFFSSLVNMEQVREHVLKPLMAGPSGHQDIPDSIAGMIHYIWSTAVQVTQGTTTTDISVLPDAAVKGELILLIEGVPEALVLDMRQIDMRGVEQPQTEQVIRGPVKVTWRSWRITSPCCATGFRARISGSKSARSEHVPSRGWHYVISRALPTAGSLLKRCAESQ